MSGLILIDTSIWILGLRAGNLNERETVDRVLAEDKGATTGTVILELLGGAKTLSQFEELKKDMEALHYFSVTYALWGKASRLAFDLRRKGLTIPATDVLIASVALSNNLLLLHADSHFDLIAKHSNLKAESLPAH